MAAPAVLLLLLVVSAVPAHVFARIYTVGDSPGWNTAVDYTAWVSGKIFVLGDSLLFVYSNQHAVDQVNQADYNSCTSSNAISSYSGGSTNFNLTTLGTFYFLCPTPGHCNQGMKLAVTVSATAPPPPPGTTSGIAQPPPPPPPPRPSSSSTIGNGVGLGAALMVLAPLALMG